MKLDTFQAELCMWTNTNMFWTRNHSDLNHTASEVSEEENDQNFFMNLGIPGDDG